jgi:glutamyl-tRNA synthetase
MVQHNSPQMVRTRLAASPTGYPHIGTLYQALFNFAYAKKNKGKFIVRIEDTDRNRFVEGSEEVIFKTLDWSGIVEDESPRKKGEYEPYRQSQRLSIYHKYAEELLLSGNAYYSFFPKSDAGTKKDYSHGQQEKKTAIVSEAPPASIEEMIQKGDWVIRMRVPKNEKISFRDEIRGEITFNTSEVTEQVLIKSDGFPTYHLAVVVDDYLMKISHIVRAEEWLSSTPKHVLLYRYLGWEMPPIFHTATLRNPDKSKLSKRHGHTNVLWFQEQGYIPEAVINFLALLGWTHPEEKEIFSLNEFIELFDLKDIRPIAPIFDLKKLTWMNQQYIQAFSDAALKKIILNFSTKSKELPETTLDALLPLLKSRMETLSDFEKLTGIFFGEFSAAVFERKEKEIAHILMDKLMNIPNWDKEHIFAVMKEVMASENIKMPIFYKLVTGQERGLPLPESLEIFGKEKTITRLTEISK